jgi:hypothetical protein
VINAEFIKCEHLRKDKNLKSAFTLMIGSDDLDIEVDICADCLLHLMSSLGNDIVYQAQMDFQDAMEKFASEYWPIFKLDKSK